MSAALGVSLHLLTTLNDAEDSIDPDEFKTLLVDMAKFQANAIFKEFTSRRAFITPLFPDISPVLDRNMTDRSLLYGSKLEKDLKGTRYVSEQADVVDKLSKAVANASTSRSNFLGLKKEFNPGTAGRRGDFPVRGKGQRRLVFRRGQTRGKRNRKGKNSRQVYKIL